MPTWSMPRASKSAMCPPLLSKEILVSRRVNAHRTRGARNRIKNDIGGLGPDNRFRRVLVVRRDEAAQLAAEVAHAGERAATHRPPFELGEPPLDGVEPGGARRREMQREARMGRQPGGHLGRLV